MNITLVSAEKVPELFSRRIRNRPNNESIFVTSMSAQFESNPIIQNLTKHGSSNDTFVVDYFGHWHGSIPTRSIKNDHVKARNLFRKNFRGSYIVVGPPPRINLTNSTILNRSHVKAYVVGDRVLSLGGVNCVPASYYDFIDVMLDFESNKFVSFLHELSEKNGNLRKDGVGKGFWLDERNEVLIDYGRRNNFYGSRNKSIILSSLLNDIEKDLSSVTISSTYIPYGKLDNILSRHVQRGRHVAFYTNNPSKFCLPQHSAYEKFLQKFYALKATTPWIDKRPDKFNHLKAAIIKYPTGDRVAYVGSHNFHELAVWAGTAEICLRTTDEKLINQLERFMAENLDVPAQLNKNTHRRLHADS